MHNISEFLSKFKMFLKMFWHPRENDWPRPLAADFWLRERVKGWDFTAGVDSGEEVPEVPERLPCCAVAFMTEA